MRPKETPKYDLYLSDTKPGVKLTPTPLRYVEVMRLLRKYDREMFPTEQNTHNYTVLRVG